MRSTKTSITASPKAKRIDAVLLELLRGFQLGQRPGIAFDEFAEPVQHGFGWRIARGQTVARLFEARRAFAAMVEADQPPGHESGAAREEVEAGAPGDLTIADLVGRTARHAVEVDHRGPFGLHGLETGERQVGWRNFSGAGLYCLHGGRGHCRFLVDTLALEDRQRVAVRPCGEGNRNVQHVEAGQQSDAGDAEFAQMRLDRRKGLRRGHRPVVVAVDACR